MGDGHSEEGPASVLISENFAKLDEKSKKDFLKKLCLSQKVLGWIDRDYSSRILYPFNISLGPRTSLPCQIWKEFGVGIMEKAMAQLQRVKNLHGRIIPLRQEKLKRVKILSKYYVGKSPGGEFFDIIKGPSGTDFSVKLVGLLCFFKYHSFPF